MATAPQFSIDVASRPEVQELAFLVWQRRIAVGANPRRSLSMRIRHLVRQAEAAGWADLAHQVVGQLPTDRICGYCGSRVGKVRSRLLRRRSNSTAACSA